MRAEHVEYLEACRLLSPQEIALLLDADPQWQLPRDEHSGRRMNEARKYLRRQTMIVTDGTVLDDAPAETVGGTSCDDRVPEISATTFKQQADADRAKRAAEVSELATGTPPAKRSFRPIIEIATGRLFQGGAPEVAATFSIGEAGIAVACSRYNAGLQSRFRWADVPERVSGTADERKQPKRRKRRAVIERATGRRFDGGTDEAAEATGKTAKAIEQACWKSGKGEPAAFSWADSPASIEDRRAAAPVRTPPTSTRTSSDPSPDAPTCTAGDVASDDDEVLGIVTRIIFALGRGGQQLAGDVIDAATREAKRIAVDIARMQQLLKIVESGKPAHFVNGRFVAAPEVSAQEPASFRDQ